MGWRDSTRDKALALLRAKFAMTQLKMYILCGGEK